MTSVYKDVNQLRIIMTLSALCPICQKYFEDAFINKYHHILLTSSQKLSLNYKKSW